MPFAATAAAQLAQPSASGGRLVDTTGRELPLASARLSGEARGGLARAVLVQTFHNPHAEPLRVTYLLPLPHDGAVSGFAFRVGDRRVVGEVDRVKEARERFERAVVEGRTAGLVEEERGGLFTQEIGNVPPGADVVAEITVDQKLLWRPGDAAGWEWRFPTTVSPRYPGAPGRVPDAGRIEVPVADGPVAARLALSFTIRDALAEGGRVESPSHAVRTSAAGGSVAVSLEGVPLDRDVVVRWPVAAPEAGAALSIFARTGEAARSFGLLTLVPPAGEAPALPRDLVLLLDVSGSMSGEPLVQSRRVAQALLESLGPDDRLEMIAFASAPTRWRARPVEATPSNRKAAHRWLAALEAGGGTEMREGIREALRPLREGAQRQVVLFTDGQIGFEREIVEELQASLPEGSRLHTVGVGSAVNRSLTGPAARAGRGREVVVGLGEDPERAARVLVAHTAAPLVTGLAVTGDAVKALAPARPTDLYAGAPALVALELGPEGGEVVVLGRTPAGTFERRLRVPAAVPGEGQAAIPALFAREAVEDLEMRAAAGERTRALDAAIERIGLDFQIATRLTSWVAISEEPTVDPAVPVRREVMPHALPHGVSAEGIGLRGIAARPAVVLSARKRAVDREDFSAREDHSILREELLAPSFEPPPSAIRMKARGTAGKPSSGETRRILARARIVLREDGAIVLEIAPSSALTWSPPAHARVGLGQGQAFLDLLPARSTRAGEIAAGASLRVALDRTPLDDAQLATLGFVELELPDGGRLVALLQR